MTSSNPNGTSATTYSYDGTRMRTTKATSTFKQVCGSGTNTLTQSLPPEPVGHVTPTGSLTQYPRDSSGGSCSAQT